jgi:hypothetical protein
MVQHNRSVVFLLPAGRHNGPERFPGRSGHHEGDEAPKLGTAVGYVLSTLLEMLNSVHFH